MSSVYFIPMIGGRFVCLFDLVDLFAMLVN